MTDLLMHINELSVYPDNHLMKTSNAIIRHSILKPSTHNNIHNTQHKSQIFREKCMFLVCILLLFLSE